MLFSAQRVTLHASDEKVVGLNPEPATEPAMEPSSAGITYSDLVSVLGHAE